MPAILEWPAVIEQPRATSMRCSTSDIYPTLLEIAGVSIANQPVLDGISLTSLIQGAVSQRPKPMGFWDYPVRGIRTPSAQWMKELHEAQQVGGDLEPHPSSQQASGLPHPPFPIDSFPGHAAWIDGDWKLHRIANKQGEVTWQLYNLKSDAAEKVDLVHDRTETADRLKPSLNQWLRSVAHSLNGSDY